MRPARWLLGFALSNPAEREMVLGDLEEELPRHGRLWYYRQALSIAGHALVRPAPPSCPTHRDPETCSCASCSRTSNTRGALC